MAYKLVLEASSIISYLMPVQVEGIYKITQNPKHSPEMPYIFRMCNAQN